MSLDRHTYYDAHCDMRLNRDTGQPMGLEQATKAVEAWAAADFPGAETGRPEWHALGDHCRATSDRFYATSPAEAKRSLMGAGWKFVPRGKRLSPWTFCPQHRECR